MKNSANQKKRIRLCLKCGSKLPNRNKCDNCGIRFRDGFLVRWLKKFLGYNPK
ncbi:MAG: hypothetical protein K1X72_11755 [Pyrinomonadaceae bacterium]|nr:hypothetical protein [Pyrinomonadaceae bacterium]